MPENDIFDRALGWLAVLAFAALGRLMWHADQVRLGHRKFWSWILALDMIIACGMGVIAHGACVHFGITGHVAGAIIAASGYLGPHAIDVVFTKRFGADSPAKKGTDNEKS